MAIVILLGIYFAAWMIQSTILLNHDVSWLMQASKRMFEGGSYTQDFFELNPPMILYIYIPVVYLVKLLSISTIIALRIWIFFLASCSLFMCYFFLRTNTWLLLCIATTFLILPIYEFGQRESILLILMMPYLLLISHRLEAGAIGAFYAFGIGLFSGFGFALKPYFLLTPILLELYVFSRNKSNYSCKRPELIALMLVLLTYMLSVIVFHRDYLTLVVPLVSNFYYASLHFSWGDIFGVFPIIYIGLVALCYLVECQNDQDKPLNLEKAVESTTRAYCTNSSRLFDDFSPHRMGDTASVKNHQKVWKTQHSRHSRYDPTAFSRLKTVLFIGVISLFVVYLIGRAPWYYHALPTYSLSVILMALLLQQWAARLQKKAHVRLEIVAVFVLLFFFDSAFSFYSDLNAGGLAGLFVCILFLFFYKFPSSRARRFKMKGGWPNSRLITTLFLLLINTVVFILPIEYSMRLYTDAVNRKEGSIPLVKFLQDNASHRTVYFFSTLAASTYPFIDYADATCASRISFLIWIAAGWLPNLDKPHTTHSKTELFLMNMVIDDIRLKKPEFVFVDTISHTNYLSYFLENQEFKTIWKSYQYLNTLEVGGMYRYDVYERATKIF